MRKNTSVLFLLIFIISSVQAQITVRDTKIQEKAIIKPVPFDSIEDFTLYNNKRYPEYKKYIGQEVYFIPKSKKFQATSGQKERLSLYDRKEVGFFKYDFEKKALKNKIAYKEVEGKYFILLDVKKSGKNINDLLDVKYEEDEFALPPSFVAFILVEKETNNYFIWILDNDSLDFLFRLGNSSGSRYSLLVSYFVRTKNLYVGKKFIALNDIEDNVDINSAEKITIEKGSVWKCTDLSLLELEQRPLLEPYFILENDKGKAVSFKLPLNLTQHHLRHIEKNRFPSLFISEEEQNAIEEQKNQELEQQRKVLKEREERRIAEQKKFEEQCIAKFGDADGRLIIEGKVKIGMTKEMCEMSWGKPYYINKTILTNIMTEQWVYSLGNYLYFDGDKLTAIQNSL